MKRVYLFCFLLICALLISSCANRSFDKSSYNRHYYVKNKMIPVAEEEIEHFLHSLQGLDFVAPSVVKKVEQNSCRIYIASKFHNRFIKQVEDNPYYYFEYHVIADNNKDVVLAVKLPPNSYTIGYLNDESCKKGFYDIYGSDLFSYSPEVKFSNVFMEGGIEIAIVPYATSYSHFSSVATDNVISYSFEEKVKPLKGLCIYRGCKVSLEKYIDIIASYLRDNNGQ